ncbi:hypothetical protein TruAng_000741 [Truncatella angustata]|nr:hypothetical protein TruAng_000741 [Truncatella angustata]
MKFFFASMIICSLAALADTTPVPDVGSSGVAFMTKTCRSTGMSGGCSASIDSGKGFCLNYAYGFKSAKVYDHFQCQFYSLTQNELSPVRNARNARNASRSFGGPRKVIYFHAHRRSIHASFDVRNNTSAARTIHEMPAAHKAETGESSTSAAKKLLNASTNGNGNGSGASNYELPWVEKYRPVFLDDVVGNTETIERLKIIAKDGNMPHVIISGMPGIGKTTSVLCLARQLLGDSYKEAVLELNASDERGIDVVRNRIKGFAQKKVTLPAGRHKIVILDEADSMTSGAQQALRRTMEIYSNTTRFAFACNQSNKVIEPLQSRCAILRYARLTDAQVVKRLLQIIEAEKVQYSDDGLAALVFSAEGDMRQAINNLQSTHAGFGFVSGDNVFRVVDSPHPIKVQAMLKACYDGNIDSAMDSLRELWDLGYSCHDIISTMFKVTKTIPTLSEHSKLEFIKEIGFTHMKILEGVQTLLQLSGCVARLCKINMDPKRFEAKIK